MASYCWCHFSLVAPNKKDSFTGWTSSSLQTFWCSLVPAFLWVKLLYFFQYLDYQVSRKRRGLYHIYFQHQEIIFESWTVNLSGWSLRTVKGPSSAHSSRFPQRQSVLLLSCQRRRKPLLAVRPGPRLHDSWDEPIPSLLNQVASKDNNAMIWQKIICESKPVRKY